MDLRSDTIDFVKELLQRVLNGDSVTEQETLEIAEQASLSELLWAANVLRESFRGNKVDLCSIVNAKSGACPEDCSYCAQSARYSTDVEVFPLLPKSKILESATIAKNNGAKRFCIVTSGKKPSPSELKKIAEAISEIRNIGLLPCATLGILSKDELSFLRDYGLYRYHHNLETSEEFFPRICTTHTYKEKLSTINAAKEVGLSVCSGGIFGLGETWFDRIKMAFLLKKLDIDSVPINFLIPIKGTPLGNRKRLHPFEALKIVAIMRIILPTKQIRICGGRFQTLGHFNSMIFLAGADGLLIGNYLTQRGCTVEEDWELIKAYGLQA